MPFKPQASPPGSSKSGLAQFLNLFPSITLPMFLAIIDQTIVATALPSIAGELGSPDRVSWVVISYLVASTIVAPAYGRLGDALGRKRLMLVALAIFTAASLLCAASTSIEMLAGARVLQGIGGGGLMTLSQALIGETVPLRDRPRYQGYLAAIGVTSSTVGPIVGGLLTDSFGWRSIFLVNLPLAGLAAILALRLPARPASGTPFRFDFPGLALFAVFIASSVAVLQLAQRLGAANASMFLALLALGVAAAIVLVWHESRATEALLPLPLFRNPAIWRADVLAVMHGAALVSLMTFVPIYLRVVHGAAAGEIGRLLLPMAAGIGVGSLVTGWLVSRTGRTAIFPSVAMLVVVVILAFVAVASAKLSTTALSWLLGATTLFMGSVMGVVQLTVQIAAGQAMLGTAAASVQFSRSLGAALGTAVVSTVVFATIANVDSGAASLFGAILQQGPEIIAALPPARQVAVQSEIGNAFRAAFLTVAGFAAVAAALAWTLPTRRI